MLGCCGSCQNKAAVSTPEDTWLMLENCGTFPVLSVSSQIIFLANGKLMKMVIKSIWLQNADILQCSNDRELTSPANVQWVSEWHEAARG